MVPGQVITQETIDFPLKLDVKEIHGYNARESLKLVRPKAVASTETAGRGRMRSKPPRNSGTSMGRMTS